ncbi:MAG: lysine exporter LysO family protein [Methylocystaceae bacterium]
MWMPFFCLLVGLAFSRWTRLSSPLMFVSLLILLGAMGIKIGSEPAIFYNLPRLGLKALIFLAMIMMVSLTFTVIIEHIFRLRKGYEESDLNLSTERTAEVRFISLILAALVIGMLLGRLINIPVFWYEKTISYALMVVFISVGMGMSAGIKSLLQNGRVWLYLILPLVFMLASLVGAGLAGMMTGVPLREALAIGGGMGYYSVAGPLVTQSAGADLGFIAFLTNFLREILTFFLTPFIIRISFLMPLALGGATVMDTTLAVVRRYLGPELAWAGFISGVVLTLLVPLFEVFILL